MKIKKRIASLLLVASILFCGTNFEVFAAEDETRKVDESYKTCYTAGLDMVIKEKNDSFEVHSLGQTISWEAEKTNEDMYTACNVYARKTSPNKDNKNELCLSAGTIIKRVGISDNGWDIIKYDNELYFMWYDYIIQDAPYTTDTDTELNSTIVASAVKDFTDSIVKDEDDMPIYVVDPEPTTEETTGVYAGYFTLTAYEWTGSPCADGVYPQVGYTVACNNPELWHHWVYIEGYGTYYVHDTGAMGYGVIDIYKETYDACIQFGVQGANVYIVD